LWVRVRGRRRGAARLSVAIEFPLATLFGVFAPPIHPPVLASSRFDLSVVVVVAVARTSTAWVGRSVGLRFLFGDWME
jgi:hypothetical protein